MSMNGNTKSTDTPQVAPKEKPGFFKGLVEKIDSAMKRSAEKKAGQGGCCGPDETRGKGGKCC